MPKVGIIRELENTLKKLQDGQKEISKRLSRIEKLADKKVAGKAKPPGRKPGKKPRKKPGRKPGKKKRGRPPKKVAKRGRKPGPKKVCSSRGCKKPPVAKGLCANHYQQMRRRK